MVQLRVRVRAPENKPSTLGYGRQRGSQRLRGSAAARQCAGQHLKQRQHSRRGVAGGGGGFTLRTSCSPTRPTQTAGRWPWCKILPVRRRRSGSLAAEQNQTLPGSHRWKASEGSFQTWMSARAALRCVVRGGLAWVWRCRRWWVDILYMLGVGACKRSCNMQFQKRILDGLPSYINITVAMHAMGVHARNLRGNKIRKAKAKAEEDQNELHRVPCFMVQIRISACTVCLALPPW